MAGRHRIALEQFARFLIGPGLGVDRRCAQGVCCLFISAVSDARRVREAGRFLQPRGHSGLLRSAGWPPTILPRCAPNALRLRGFKRMPLFRFRKLEDETNAGSGFGRKGLPAGAAAPRRHRVPGGSATVILCRTARASFVAQERSNAAADVSTLAWNTPISGRSWNRSRLIAYLLWFFWRARGHRIYCGRYISGALQAIIEVVATSVMVISPDNVGTWGPLLLILCVWFLFDAFLIPGMCRKPPAAH